MVHDSLAKLTPSECAGKKEKEASHPQNGATGIECVPLFENRMIGVASRSSGDYAMVNQNILNGHTRALSNEIIGSKYWHLFDLRLQTSPVQRMCFSSLKTDQVEKQGRERHLGPSSRSVIIANPNDARI
jgi:hypothetical protein